MALFQQAVLKKYIHDLNKENLQTAWLLFQSHFHHADIQHNILHAKEEEYQEGFVRDLFVNILGYTLKPQPGYNLVMEQKSTSDATKSDGAILSATGAVTGVIELKDTNTTDLDKVAKQAFGYKHQHKDCVYIITANFEKLRFYISDAIDFEEFDLFRLSKERFAVLYCCLQQQALHNDVPLKMKQQSLAEEENITKKLYADYSRFKKQLFASITQKNPQYNPLELFKKTQKLLDRFLFILFAEDRLLLPPNSVREILQQWEQLKELDNYVPLYDRFKKYFGYLNTGYQGKQYEIFAYNGGLFAPDDLLDNITIEDELLYNSTKTLSNYDFESEVDVNILGHIFEHSLNEIEEVEKELTAALQLKEAEGESVDATNVIADPASVESITSPLGRQGGASKRKKDGVFYTPRYITKYIVENTLGTICSQQKEALQIVEADFAPQKRKANTKQLQQRLDEYRQWLLQLTICDPACGSGAFLNQALEFLIAEHKSIDELTGKLFGDAMVLSDVEASILENNLYGVDINDEATEIAKLSLWLRTARKGRKLNNLNQHIKCGNSLIDDPAVAGDKAFNWQQEFPQVFAKGGFDVVIGNPPYVRVEFIGKADVAFYKKAFKSSTGKFDLSSLFIEKAVKIINIKGLISIISSYQFIYTSSGKGVREFISQNTSANFLIFTSENQIFQGATTYTAILNFSLKRSTSIIINKANVEFSEIIFKETLTILNEDFNKEKVIISNNSLIEKIRSNINISFGKEIGSAKTGVVTSSDEVFFLTKDSISKNNLETKIIYPIIGSDEIFRWFLDETNTYCLYPYKEQHNKTVLLELDTIQLNFKNIYDYLINRKAILQARSQGRKDYTESEKWYQLNRPREKWIYDSKKILYPGTINKPMFALDEVGQMFRNARSYTFVLNDSNNIGLYKFILCLLNSRLSFFFITSLCPPKSGGYFELSTSFLEEFPFAMSENQLPFIAQADIMLSKTKELQQIRQQLLQLLQGKYPQLVLSKKLQDWPGLAFRDFLKELEKQKIKLSLPEQAEWMQYVEAEKARANTIQQLIAQTDKTIDAMVYELYQLTPEEIKIVEGNG